MPKFQMRPQVIEAHRWLANGDHPNDYPEDHESTDGQGNTTTYTPEQQRDLGWEGKVVRRFRVPSCNGESKCRLCGNALHSHGWIDNGNNGDMVCPGDWIITRDNGVTYPCKPDIFEELYEAVPDE